MENFRDLKVWRKSHDLTLAVYKLTRKFPKDEIYGLTSQMRRACASIGANIAEGCGRRSDAEMNRFLQIARGSASEAEYHVLLARDLGFLTDLESRDLETRVLEVERMLAGLSRRLKSPILARS